MSRPTTVMGMFAGVGGFEIGMSRAGMRPVGLCEIWEPAVAVLQHRLPGVPLHNDVCDLERPDDASTTLPDDIDVLTAGFPCTDLSQAGMMAGIRGEHSGLVYEVFRVLHRRAERGRPIPWVVIENVRNMLHLQRGNAMTVIIEALEGMGYRWAYRLVDSRAFGTPQRRQRVFLVASLEGDPRDVLLVDDAGDPDIADRHDWSSDTGVGFYWTEGLRGLGWAHEGVPTLKGGSTIGIPSSPAVLLPSGDVVCPDIRDAERMQGFDEDWTAPAEAVARSGFRWKLVGNAVTVDVAEWLGRRLRSPGTYDAQDDAELAAGAKWPKAAWGGPEGRFASAASMWPDARPWGRIDDFLRHPGTPLSARAAAGFLSRATSPRCTLRFPDGFLAAIEAHRRRMAGEPALVVDDPATEGQLMIPLQATAK